MNTENRKIFVFGDSFAEINENDDFFWQLSASQDLERDLINVATNGAASNWIISKLQEIETYIEEDDYLILIIPYWERICIFTEHPDLTSLISFNNLSAPHVKEKWKNYNQQQIEAFKSYFMYLKDDSLTKSVSSSLVHWINSIGSRLKTKPLIIDSHNSLTVDKTLLNNCSVANGNLFDVCVGEFKDIRTWEKLISAAPFVDFRTGHMTKINHEIMSKKIIDYFKHDTLPDLEKGFYSNFIDDIKIESIS